MHDLRELKINDEDTMFHYTSSGGLLGILKGKSIWFSNIKFLNDEQEVSYTHKMLLEEIEELSRNQPSNFLTGLKDYYSPNLKDKSSNNCNNNIFESEYYVACFSNNKDSLSLWNYYTKSENSTGYNIEFNKELFINSLKLTAMDIHGQVIYDKEKQRRLIKNFLTKFNNSFENTTDRSVISNLCSKANLIISFYSLFFKHPAFENEEEYRVLIEKNRINDDKFKCSYREYRDFFIPYTEKKFIKKCIKSIRISPTQKKQITKDSVERMLKDFGYKKVPVNNSEIPLRY